MGGTGRIAVFGGSGKTGQEFIAAALRHGLRVRALYRPGSEPQDRPQGLEVLTGQLTAEDVRRTLEGTDGAVVVFGPRLGSLFSGPPEPPKPFCAPATAAIVAEMKRLGIERLVCQTGAMAGGDNPNWSPRVRRFVERYRRQFPAINADRDAQEVVVRESGLDWTLVRPFRIANGRRKAQAHVAPSIRIGMFTSVRRANLAEFLVGEVTGGRWHRRIVYIVT